VSPIVEAFYNQCHGGTDGKFCGTGMGSGKVITAYEYLQRRKAKLRALQEKHKPQHDAGMAKARVLKLARKQIAALAPKPSKRMFGFAYNTPMAAHTFESKLVEEFYNSCHTHADGRFCGVASKGKKYLRVPMSAAAQRSNAILRSTSAARKSPEYKAARKAMGGSWARREHGQGGNIGKGANSAKADRARAANAQHKNPANKDKSEKLVGGYKHSGNKVKDLLQISRLDRGSPARKAAAQKFEAAYGKG
jgi:hypothetical protein